ncbi:unnamed protein product [Leptosia nina]|uniref:Acyltransferase 3 domain-containing protein n=1 Tax=Leptosia nina TaxID=320188 RepID=A0AAV1JW84_9NEOP
MMKDQISTIKNLPQEYASDPRHFDRTLLHRGYCLTTRCPSSETNTTLRFEQCVEQHALTPGVKASLQSHFCVSRENKPRNLDRPELIFLAVLGVVLAFNVVGTLYDILQFGKNTYLQAWSVRYNWQKLITTYEEGDPRVSSLTAIQGIRVLLLVLVMMTHSSEIQHKLYLYNPGRLEQFLQQSVTMLIRNGSALVMGFVVISNFLFGYSLLVLSKTRKLGLAQLPMCLLHRIIRLAPVHLLVIGFAATWWRHAGDGPQWSGIVSAESEVCRKKFLSHVFFMHNLINPEEHCLLQTWFLAVDFQLYVVAAALSLWLLQTGRRAIPFLTTLFFGSCLLNVVLAYFNDWKSLLYIMLPENVRTTFHDVPSFYRFYVAPWGSLPSCFLGLLLAHVYFHMQENGFKIFKYKLLVWTFHLIVPIHVGFILCGNYIKDTKSGFATALYMGAERPAFAALAAFYVLAVANNVDSVVRRIFAVKLFQILGRISLPVLMLHWCVNMMLVASRRTLSEVSVQNIASDLISTIWWTYVLAIPVSLLVEAPIQKCFNSFVKSRFVETPTSRPQTPVKRTRYHRKKSS